MSMVTVTETTTRTLSTAEEIATFLEQRYTQMIETSPFKAGEAVSIANRAGLPSDLGTGNVALMLLDAPGAWSHVLLLTANGTPVAVQVDSSHLAKRLPDVKAGE